MRHATLRQLKVFEAIARHLSFTRAAEELHLTQPTVSMQIKQLSGTVSMPLFEQIGKRIHLTGAGQALHATCREIFDSIERFEMDVANRKGLKKGRLKLAVITTAEYFAPRLLGPFCQRHPGIDVSLKVTNRESVLERLVQNQDDLYILGQPPEHLDTHYQPFMENPLVVLAPGDHPLVGRKRITLQRIAQEPFLMREPGSGTRIATQRLFDKHKIALNIRMELGSNEAIKQAIAGGLGIAVLSRHSLALEGETGPLRILDVQGFPIQRQWYLVYPEGKQLSIIAQTFYDYLLDEGKQMAEAAFVTKARRVMPG
ncbi:MAG: LysR substrate-binding domain-containing protein [Gammaproteobacteria bacterium]